MEEQKAIRLDSRVFAAASNLYPELLADAFEGHIEFFDAPVESASDLESTS